MKICSEEGCGRPIVARNLCKMHYQRAVAYGNLPPKGRTGRTAVPVTHPTYKVWAGIKTRCTNTNRADYTRYGGQGVTYDPAWEDFNNFYADMGSSYQEGLWIDRIDNKKGYFKENCRWVTPTESSRNRRYVKVTADTALAVRRLYETGEHTQSELASRFGLDQTTISDIIRRKSWADV